MLVFEHQIGLKVFLQIDLAVVLLRTFNHGASLLFIVLAIFLFVRIGAPLWLQSLIVTCSVAIKKRGRERKGKRATTSRSAFHLNTSSLLFAKLFAHVETETGSLLNLVVIRQIWF